MKIMDVKKIMYIRNRFKEKIQDTGYRKNK